MDELMFPLEDTEYLAEDMRLLFATRSSGVYGNDHLNVTPAGGMTVALSDGVAWLRLGKTGGVTYVNRTVKELTVEVADASYPRIDRLMIRYDAISNTGYTYIKKGVPASSPVPPSLTRDETAYELSRAQIRVNAGATEITEANITDELMDESVCGVMSDGMDRISTEMLYAQVNALLARLKGALQAVYDDVQLVNTTEFSGTLLASGWSGSGPYSQTISAPGVLGADKPMVDVDLTSAEDEDVLLALNDAWGLILKAAPESGYVRFLFSQLPDMDIPVKIRVVR